MKLALIEDSEGLRSAMCSVLTLEGFEVIAFSSAEEAQELSFDEVDCIVSDFKLPIMDGIALVEIIRSRGVTAPILMMTAYGTIEIAVEALKKGANDFITKPFEVPALVCAIRELIKHNRVITREHVRHDHVYSKSPKMIEVLALATKAAAVDSTIMLFGESGAGKEVLAKFIHERSPRRDSPFVAVNCAALPPDLLESEFFGHEAGAFTGATCRREGLLEIASNGTIFLDEVGEMSKHLQVKLLRALQEKEITRLGSSKTIRINPRIIAATNVDRDDLLHGGLMREDLFYRLAVITLKIPPLRERREDIRPLIELFLEEFSHKFSKQKLIVSPATNSLLERYPWPGNIRELRHAIERASLLSDRELDPKHLGIDLKFDAEMQAISLQRISELASKTAETEIIIRTLAYTNGNKTKAAKILGVNYKTFLQKIKDFGIETASLKNFVL